MPEETYLGDGLYASVSMGYITLRAPHHDVDMVVYLEPAVYAALRRFAREAGFEPVESGGDVARS